MPIVPMDGNKGFTEAEMKEMESAPELPAEGDDAPADDGDGDEGGGAPPALPPGGAAQQPTKPPKGYLPIAAVQEERERVKAERARADKYEANWNKLLTEMRAAQQPQVQQPQAPQIPAFNDDPAAHLYLKAQHTEQELAAMKRHFQERQAYEREMQESNARLQAYAGAVEQDAKTDEGKDFQAAYQHLSAARDAELAHVFPDAQERKAKIEYEEGYIVGMAMQRGMNPGKVLHDMAKARGYAPKPPADKLAILAKGQKAAKTLSGASMAPADGVDEFSQQHLSMLEDSDPEAAAAAWAKLGRMARKQRG